MKAPLGRFQGARRGAGRGRGKSAGVGPWGFRLSGAKTKSPPLPFKRHTLAQAPVLKENAPAKSQSEEFNEKSSEQPTTFWFSCGVERVVSRENAAKNCCGGTHVSARTSRHSIFRERGRMPRGGPRPDSGRPTKAQAAEKARLLAETIAKGVKISPRAYLQGVLASPGFDEDRKNARGRTFNEVPARGVAVERGPAGRLENLGVAAWRAGGRRRQDRSLAQRPRD